MDVSPWPGHVCIDPGDSWCISETCIPWFDEQLLSEGNETVILV